MCQAANQILPVPCPVGLEYLPYQLEGIEFARDKNRVLLADAPGLGKTVQAIGWINCHPEINSALVVCPATLKINWARELDKWLMRPWIDLTVTNYDQLHKLAKSRRYDVAILDEAHYIKTPTAIRTRHCHEIKADNHIALTGTPLLHDRPIEMYEILRWLRPDFFNDNMRKRYAIRYCNRHLAYRVIGQRNGKPIIKKYWDESGASNLDELQAKLRESLMVRRLKSDVLKDLPPKRRQILELQKGHLSRDLRDRMAAATRHIDKLEDTYKEDVSKLDDALRVAFQQMAKLRHETGLAKVPMALEVIHNAVQSSGKVVVFAHHREVIDALREGLVDYHPVVIHGGISSSVARQAAIDTFQTDDKCRIFIGQIQAAGVGVTLTASAHVIFVELDWTPGLIEQASDRVHRIGQKESVLVQFLALENSLDARMAKALLRKAEVIEKALDA